MWNKDSKRLQAEIDYLKREIELLKEENRIRYGLYHGIFSSDPRPSMRVKDAVIALMDRMGLEIVQIPASDAKAIIARKPKKTTTFKIKD